MSDVPFGIYDMEEIPPTINITKSCGLYEIRLPECGDTVPVLAGSRDLGLTETELRELLVVLARYFAEHADL